MPPSANVGKYHSRLQHGSIHSASCNGNTIHSRELHTALQRIIYIYIYMYGKQNRNKREIFNP